MNFIRFESIGTSLGGIDIPILKISSPESSPTKGLVYPKKPIILIIGRQHSGETHSSYIIHGLINFLVQKNAICTKMRALFEWWVIPVVNPDGVIAGNYRCNV
jgi:murein tripeptide amidase MpaA